MKGEHTEIGATGLIDADGITFDPVDLLTYRKCRKKRGRVAFLPPEYDLRPQLKQLALTMLIGLALAQ